MIVWLRRRCPQNLDIAVNIDGRNPTEQTREVTQNIRLLIEESGGSMEHLMKVVAYVIDARHCEALYRTIGEQINRLHPVSTGLVM